MRVLTVLVALVAMPFAVGVSQDRGRGHDAEHCAARAARHPDKDINKCDPAPTCPVTSTLSGPLSISGIVKVAGGDGLPNWCVQLFSDLGTATTGTDASGSYVFPSLPVGTYLICEVLQDGWEQTYPLAFLGAVPCPTGLGLGPLGWPVPLEGGDAPNIEFSNRRLQL
jgi:hypothetical protein